MKVYSKILNDTIYFASNDEAMNKCGTLSGVVYTVDELRELIRKKVPEKELRLLHLAKKEFNGKIVN